MHMNTQIITLKFGYLDAHGEAHREAELRAPVMDDEIKASGICEAAKTRGNMEGASDSFYELALVSQCLVRLGAVRPVTIDHLRAMKRADVAQLSAALHRLEAEDYLTDEEKKASADAPPSSPAPS
jgi:phage FluMu protein gp41